MGPSIGVKKYKVVWFVYMVKHDSDLQVLTGGLHNNKIYEKRRRRQQCLCSIPKRRDPQRGAKKKKSKVAWFVFGEQVSPLLYHTTQTTSSSSDIMRMAHCPWCSHHRDDSKPGFFLSLSLSTPPLWRRTHIYTHTGSVWRSQTWSGSCGLVLRGSTDWTLCLSGGVKNKTWGRVWPALHQC